MSTSTVSGPPVCTLEDAVAQHVRPGDTVHVVCGHSRWTALLREVARQYWGVDAGFTLVQVSLSSLAMLLFKAGCLRRVVTAYSGDSFPNLAPNPTYQKAYRAGDVEVEHWTYLTLIQRLEAAAQGLPAMVTGSLSGSSMAANAGYTEQMTPWGPVGMVSALTPDVALVHGAVADRAGNVAMPAPLQEGVAGALAARRGVVASVEQIVDDLRPWASHVRIPGHRVLALVEAPFGAHPGGLFVGGGAQGMPVEGYGEDVDFWIEARNAARRDPDAWIRQWCLDVPTHDDYLQALGPERLARLRRRADAESWRDDAAAMPINDVQPITSEERAAVWAAQLIADRVSDCGADAVLAGAGVANLAAWLAVAETQKRGLPTVLTAEIGTWGYVPTPADPYIFNLRAFPSSTMLTDTRTVLGTLMGGPGTRTVACVGTAQYDRHGNLNTTEIPDGPFLVGSGGANDIVTRADEVVVVSKLNRRTAVERCGYITSPGDRVYAVVTDRAVLHRRDGELVITAVSSLTGELVSDIRATREHVGWDVAVAPDVAYLPPVAEHDVRLLRDHDRLGSFLGHDHPPTGEPRA